MTEVNRETERDVSTKDLAGVQSPDDEALSRDDMRDDRPTDGARAIEDERPTPLLEHTDAEGFQGRWREIQTSFVDEPRRAVEDADGLVAELMQRLAASFAEQRGELERQWDRGDDVSTEDLRVALTRYRSFFERLLAA